MTDPFEQEVRDAARGLGSPGQQPSYHDAYMRGTQRRFRKRAVLAVSGALALIAAFGVTSGRFVSPTVEVDDIAIRVGAITPVAEQTSTPTPRAGDAPAKEPATTLDADADVDTPPATTRPQRSTAVPVPGAESSDEAESRTVVEEPPLASGESPSPVPTTSQTTTPTTSPTASPTGTPSPTAEPSPTPNPSLGFTEPTPTPTTGAGTTATGPGGDDAADTSTVVDPTPSATSTPEVSAAIVAPSSTPVPTAVPTSTPVPTAVPTSTPVPTAVPTSTPSPTPTAASFAGAPGFAAMIDPPTTTNGPCDTIGDLIADASCELFAPYPCSDASEALPNYTAIDTNADDLIDTCQAFGLASCDTIGDFVGDTPCIVTPD